MEKPKELLIIEPKNELHFVGPFTRPVMNIMKITNPTDHTILFKIKTTAPKRYCVRPNFGSIEPHSHSKIEICLQPFVYDPNDKNKHKFMVQSLVVDKPDEDLNKLWRDAEPHELMDVKLRCVFEMPVVEPENTGGQKTVTNELSKELTSKVMQESKTNTAAEEKVSNLISSLQRDEAADELKRLRMENEELLAERRRLMDQVIKARNTSAKQPYQQVPYTPILGDKQIPTFYIVIAIVILILGFLIGKYF